MKWALRERDAVAEQRTLKELEKMSQAPITSLMLEEVEKRIDVFIFRCCFAHSVYEARRLVIHGRVKLNGKKVRLCFNAGIFGCNTERFLAYECEYPHRTGRYGLCRPFCDTVPPAPRV